MFFNLEVFDVLIGIILFYENLPCSGEVIYFTVLLA